jgi:hypothetical protein
MRELERCASVCVLVFRRFLDHENVFISRNLKTGRRRRRGGGGCIEEREDLTTAAFVSAPCLKPASSVDCAPSCVTSSLPLQSRVFIHYYSPHTTILTTPPHPPPPTPTHIASPDSKLLLRTSTSAARGCWLGPTCDRCSVQLWQRFTCSKSRTFTSCTSALFCPLLYAHFFNHHHFHHLPRPPR